MIDFKTLAENILSDLMGSASISDILLKTKIFASKKGDNEYYVCYAPARCITFKSSEAQDVIRFRQQFGCMLQPYFVAGRLVFESYELKEKILSLIL